ncbi:MAG: ornithine cyclodeaminase family protein, partial [Hadesarchaea archaeon]|nr:ornithine cyclodeaminase family protein [Hadesarchaea archaeon]
MRVLLLREREVGELLSMREVIAAVEEAFRLKGEGKTQMPPKSYVFFPRHGGDFRVMPAYLEEGEEAGVKVVNVHPGNPDRGLPTVMATILLLDPSTGAPLAFMGGTLITNLRTGAAGAVAAKYLARRDSRVVGMVGAGAQARAQLRGLREVLELERVRVVSAHPERTRGYAEEVRREYGLEVEEVRGIREAVEGSDVVVTTTPSRQPLVREEWVSEGTHLNAIGADAPGKQELDPGLLRRAKVVVDDVEQAVHSGEINVPLSSGLFRREDLYGELGEIVAGKKPGRTSP